MKVFYVKIKRSATSCEFGNLLEARVTDKFFTDMKFGPILDRLCKEATSNGLNQITESAVSKESVSKSVTREENLSQILHFRNTYLEN